MQEQADDFGECFDVHMSPVYVFHWKILTTQN